MSDADLIPGLEAELTRLQVAHFDNYDAWALGCRFMVVAQERGLPIVVDIRRHGQVLFHAARPGTTPDNDAWVERKVRVVDRFHESSYLVGRRRAISGEPLSEDAGVAPIDYAAHGGAFPIIIIGVGVVGTVTVSGLPQADDHALVVEILGEFVAAR
jgi:uncharacterized protein (UPF0303 family)